MYNPVNGVFMEQDPLGFVAGDGNLYRFVGNGPTNATDPSGEADQKAQIKAGALAYYENVGWIDWNHADPGLAKSILSTIKKGENVKLDVPINPKAITTGLVFDKENRDKWFVFPVSAKGKGIAGLANPTIPYAVRTGLNEEDQKRVALGIFMDYVQEQEAAQGNWFWRWGTDSSFSQDDLPSDMIGFYRALKDAGQKETEALFGKKLGQEETLKLLSQLGGNLGLADNKNRSFQPVDHNKQVGFADPMKWPAEIPGIAPFTDDSGKWLKLSIMTGSDSGLDFSFGAPP